MAELAFSSAITLASAVRSGQIGCLELLDHYIERVERLDARLNAVVVRDWERARKRARALDGENRDEGAGPLHGVPMTVKESYDLAGLPTTWGFENRRNHRAATDALAVARLEAAGAVVFGKTNVPVGLGDWQSYNPIYGTTNNPWNVDHSPGGSSGGSAAALAAGLTGFEIGSDIAGSIRVPAAFCGVYGHKPTWALLPPRGHALFEAAAITDISAIGPLTRSADDLALGLDLLGRPDEAETALSLNLPAPRLSSLRELRVAVWAEQPGQATDPEVTALLGEVAGFLRRAGAEVSSTARPTFDPTEAFHLFCRLLNAALSGRMDDAKIAAMREAAKGYAPDDMSADAIMARTADMTHREWLALHERRHQIRRAWGTFFQSWDVLLCPAFATAALPHRQDGASFERRVTVGGREFHYNDLMFWPGLVGAFHLPSTSAPIGFTKAGLPVGMQVVGPLYGDRTTIAVARLLEKEWHGFVPPPGCD